MCGLRTSGVSENPKMKGRPLGTAPNWNSLVELLLLKIENGEERCIEPYFLHATNCNQLHSDIFN